MSVHRVGDLYHYRFMHRGRVIRRSTKQRNYKVAVEMESAHLTALSKGDAGLGEKPKAPTLGRFLVERVKPWAAKKKGDDCDLVSFGHHSAPRLQADLESRPGCNHQRIRR